MSKIALVDDDRNILTSVSMTLEAEGFDVSKIALVDDDRNILTSVSMTLEAEGFDLETYNDGQSALDAFNRRLPIWLCWISKCRMDGMELLQRLRQKTNMPVIFLTSKDDEIDEIRGLRMGADDYVKTACLSSSKTLDQGSQKGCWGKCLTGFIPNVPPMILAVILDWDWQFPNRLSKRMMGRFGLKIFVQRKWTRHLRRLAPVL